MDAEGADEQTDPSASAAARKRKRQPAESQSDDVRAEAEDDGMAGMANRSTGLAYRVRARRDEVQDRSCDSASLVNAASSSQPAGPGHAVSSGPHFAPQQPPTPTPHEVGVRLGISGSACEGSPGFHSSQGNVGTEPQLSASSSDILFTPQFNPSIIPSSSPPPQLQALPPAASGPAHPIRRRHWDRGTSGLNQDGAIVDEDGRAGNNAAASEVQQGVGRRGGRRALSAAEVRRLSEGLRPPTLPLMRETPTTAMWGDEESEDGGVLVDVGRRSGEQLGLSQRRGHESHQTGEASGSLHHNTEAARQEAMQIRDKLLDEFQCPLCFDLLCRPCPLPCGLVACEGCLARSLLHSRQLPAESRHCPVLGSSCSACKDSAQRLPNVQAKLHTHLQRLLPTDYEARLREEQVRSAPLVDRVRRLDLHVLSRVLTDRRLRRLPAPPAADNVGLDGQPRPYPAVPWLVNRPGLKRALQYGLPTLLTALALHAFPGNTPQGYESGKLRSFSTSNFAKAYVLKSMGWWDVGLLTTCTAPRTHAPPLHEVPALIESLSSPLVDGRWRAYTCLLKSRVLWPYKRLVLASWMDPLHRVLSTWHIVTWSLTVVNMLAIYVHARYRHHQRANTPWPLAVLSEARVLVPLAILCEATNFSFQWIMWTMFSKPVGGCPWYFNVTPLNVIIPGVTSLLCEVALYASLYLGAVVDPNDHPVLRHARLQPPPVQQHNGEWDWEKELLLQSLLYLLGVRAFW